MGILEAKHGFPLETSQCKIIQQRFLFEISKPVLRGGKEGEIYK